MQEVTPERRAEIEETVDQMMKDAEAGRATVMVAAEAIDAIADLLAELDKARTALRHTLKEVSE
jgi:hypothetical protein